MAKSLKDLLTEANEQVTCYTVDQVRERLDDPDLVPIDVRDEAELRETGRLPGAQHASRGLLEFHIDPTSPYHRPVFQSGKELVFYCKSGGRSAMAAQRAREMGVERVATLTGGMLAWRDAGGPTEPVD